MQPIIQEYTPAYAEQVKDLLVTLQTHIVALDTRGVSVLKEEYREGYFAHLQEGLSAARGKLFLALLGGKAIGLCAVTIPKQDKEAELCMHAPDAGFISDLVVAQAYRRKGVAKALLHAAETYCTAQGCGYVQLIVFHPNQEAAMFYRACGYELLLHHYSKPLSPHGRPLAPQIDALPLFTARQSCRAFSTRPLSHHLLEQICAAALLAPSACNAQPWQLVVAEGEKVKAIAPCLQSLGMNAFASDAQALVAVCASKSNFTARAGAKITGTDFTEHDLGVLTAHLVLAAESAGVQSCILGWRNERSLCAALDLPNETHIPVVVALGYADEAYAVRPKQRKPLSKTLRFV